MTQRVYITHPAYNSELDMFDALCEHSTYARVVQTSIEGRNVLRMVHDSGDVSMVVLGEGYTVSFEQTD